MFEFNDEAAMETGATGGYLETGVHKFTDLVMSKTVASTGTVGFDVSMQIEGQKFRTTIYGMWTHRKDGTEIFNWKTIQRLMGLNKAKKLTFFEKEVDTKDGKKKVQAAVELDNISGTVALQKVLDFYNGAVNEKKFEIKEFFNAANQTYAEAVKKDTSNKQFTYYAEKLQDGQTTEYKKYIAEGGADEAETETEVVEGELVNDGDGIL